MAYENIFFSIKWQSFKAKIGKMKKSKFSRIDSRLRKLIIETAFVNMSSFTAAKADFFGHF